MANSCFHHQDQNISWNCSQEKGRTQCASIMDSMIFNRSYLPFKKARSVLSSVWQATPIPNIPLYYAGYRVYSNYCAWTGSCTINHGLTRLDALSMLKLRTEIEQWKQDGIVFPVDSWQQRVLQEDKRYMSVPSSFTF